MLHFRVRNACTSSLPSASAPYMHQSNVRVARNISHAASPPHWPGKPWRVTGYGKDTAVADSVKDFRARVDVHITLLGSR